eukprot:1117821-Prymnesium_polylepis.1
MASHNSLYPVWRSDPLLLSEGEVEFKFAILRADGAVTWEACGNRHLALAGAEEAHVIADWNVETIRDLLVQLRSAQ